MSALYRLEAADAKRARAFDADKARLARDPAIKIAHHLQAAFDLYQFATRDTDRHWADALAAFDRLTAIMGGGE